MLVESERERSQDRVPLSHVVCEFRYVLKVGFSWREEGAGWGVDSLRLSAMDGISCTLVEVACVKELTSGLSQQRASGCLPYRRRWWLSHSLNDKLIIGSPLNFALL